MDYKFLLSYRYKKLGWVLLILGLLLGIVYVVQDGNPKIVTTFFYIIDSTLNEDVSFFGVTEMNIIEEFILLMIICGALTISFSREKVDDKFISYARRKSLIMAMYAHYTITILIIAFVHGTVLYFVLVCNTLTLPLFYIVRFNWMKFKSTQSGPDKDDVRYFETCR